METAFEGKHNRRGDWQPEEVLDYAPVFVWPPRPKATLK